MPDVLGGQKRALDPLELERCLVVGHVGAGDQTPVLWKSSQRSHLMSRLLVLSVVLTAQSSVARPVCLPRLPIHSSALYESTVHLCLLSSAPAIGVV